MSNSCCHNDNNTGNDNNGGKPKRDYLFWSMLSIIIAALAIHISGLEITYATDLAHAITELLKVMWWGIAAGMVAVGFMQHVPREYFHALLGRGDTIGGLFRAALAGLLLDLCSHGILMVGAKLYERGASLGQVMAFLIASPWNSLSITFILIALIGLPWTLMFIAGSAVIAFITGWIYLELVKHGKIAKNPHSMDILPDGFSIKKDAKKRLKNFRPDAAFFGGVLKDGFFESKMVLRWLLLGTVLAGLIGAFVPTEMLQAYFGPTLLGLLLTLLATTIIEVCSEGSAPIGAELVLRAGAPGNGFTFLMAGVATDYTEILVIREFTKSWKIAFSLPLLTVPQVIMVGWVMNIFGA